MKISGFTMGKNISKLYYPMKQSIMSILPIVDEFVIALGDSDDGDTTREIIESIGSDKIKIIDTTWDIDKYPQGTEMAHQTDIAKEHCSGDWLFYIQADEVVHEKYLPLIRRRCEELVDDKEVEGFLFKYVHFWGDYWHFHDSHGWYRNEIRIIRNDPEIHSWRDAQSFRRIPDFDGKSYRQQENTFKLKVVSLDAWVYHYGWVRPPSFMKSKIKTFKTQQQGAKVIEALEKSKEDYFAFDYGILSALPTFKGTHPAVMKEWIDRFDWKDKLQYSGQINKNRLPHKHEKFRYRLATIIEKYLLFGRPIGEFKNYILLKR